MNPTTATLRTLACGALLACGASSAWAATASEKVERRVALPASRVVVVQNLNGSVAIAGWEEADIRLVAIKTARAATEGRAQAYLREVDVRVEEKDGALRITTRTPSEQGGLRALLTCTGVDGSVEYRLSVPRHALVAATTVNGNVEVAGLGAPVRAASTNGNVTVLEVGGEVQASSVNGSIHVDLRRADPRSSMELSTVNGSIVLYVPEALRAFVDARTTNGSVGSDLPLLVSGTRSRSRLVGSLNGGSTKLTLRTTNGSIWLRRPPAIAQPRR
jgi:hypothetical protein